MNPEYHKNTFDLKAFVKQLWWDARLWAYRKLHTSLTKEYDERFHDLLMEKTVPLISKMASSSSYMEIDPEGTYCGDIPEDWLARINAKIAEHKTKEEL